MNSAIRQSGALYVQNSAGTAAADMYAGNIVASANVSANGSMWSGGRLYANEYIQPNGWAAQGGGCSPNGLIANSGNGPLFCQSGVWQTAGGARIHFDQVVYQYVGDGGYCPPNTVAIGAGGWYQTYTAGYLYCAAYY